MNLSILNRTAGEIAAAAFFETFPGVELLGGERTSLGFSYDFCCSNPLPPEVEVLIEEKMRQIIRERRPIRTLEMVPFSARELLLKEGHAFRAEELLEREGLVEIVQIGAFHDLSPGGHLKCSHELAAFKLWPLKRVGEGVFRLSGCAFFSKDELKQFLKKLRDYPEKSHIEAGLKKSLWKIHEGQLVYLPAGMRYRQEVLDVLKDRLFRGVLEVRGSGAGDPAAIHAALGAEAVAEVYQEPRLPWDPETGLFAGSGGERVRVSFFVSPEKQREKLISSLQSIGETLNILGFQHRLRLCGPKRSGKGAQALLGALEAREGEVEMDLEETRVPRLDFIVGDHLGRRWAAFSIEMVARSYFITASVERLVALLIEMKACITENER